MRTATVRDLRNNFANVAKWIEHGEQITITRHGKSFATLSPAAAAAAKPRKIDWAARLKNFAPVGKKLTKTETAAFWSKLRD